MSFDRTFNIVTNWDYNISQLYNLVKVQDFESASKVYGHLHAIYDLAYQCFGATYCLNHLYVPPYLSDKFSFSFFKYL